MLAHDYEDAAGRAPPRSRRGSTIWLGDAFAGIEFDVDLKLRATSSAFSTRYATAGCSTGR